jgi:hypothetical protein
MEAFVNLRMGQYRQGQQPVRSIITALFPSLRLSQGLISKIKKRTAAALEYSYGELLEAITSSKSPLHVDAIDLLSSRRYHVGAVIIAKLLRAYQINKVVRLLV